MVEKQVSVMNTKTVYVPFDGTEGYPPFDTAQECLAFEEKAKSPGYWLSDIAHRIVSVQDELTDYASDNDFLLVLKIKTIEDARKVEGWAKTNEFSWFPSYKPYDVVGHTIFFGVTIWWDRWDDQIDLNHIEDVWGYLGTESELITQYTAKVCNIAASVTKEENKKA